MKLQISTKALQSMLLKAVKGASNNKLLPLTSFIAIELKSGVLTLTTTDATNYFYVRETNVSGDDFYVVVQSDLFAKLVSKMTCDTITLDYDGTALKVIGNGEYKIQIPLDEDGELVKYPNPASSVAKSEENKIGVLTISTVHTIINSVKPSLITTYDYPQYTCYYAGGSVVATDTLKISGFKEQLFNEPKLISNEVMDLLGVITDDTITVYCDDNRMLFETEHYTVYGTEPSGLDEFNIDAISDLLTQPFESTCKVSKSALLQLLDRISLFVTDTNGEVTLTFSDNGILVSSKSATGTELVSYVENGGTSDGFTCSVDISMLMTQIKAQPSDIIEIGYGETNAIRIVDRALTSIIALLVD